jgi:hypothetical protein
VRDYRHRLPHRSRKARQWNGRASTQGRRQALAMRAPRVARTPLSPALILAALAVLSVAVGTSLLSSREAACQTSSVDRAIVIGFYLIPVCFFVGAAWSRHRRGRTLTAVFEGLGALASLALMLEGLVLVGATGMSCSNSGTTMAAYGLSACLLLGSTILGVVATRRAWRLQRIP